MVHVVVAPVPLGRHTGGGDKKMRKMKSGANILMVVTVCVCSVWKIELKWRKLGVEVWKKTLYM